ncbi:MAG: chromate efflux transporter [Hyphomicrobiaceae bacterium]
MTKSADQMSIRRVSGHPTFLEATREWARIGLLSFGGPTAQIALMHRVVVDERKWLSESRFLNALSFCMLLPGPEATQLATYVGWRLHGIPGGLVAGVLFVLPGAAVILMLATIYALFGNVPLVETIFFGIKAAVLVIVIEALLRISRRTLKGTGPWIIAMLAFFGIFFLALPFPLIVLLAALYGYVFTTSRDDQGDGEQPDSLPPMKSRSLASTVATIAIWLAVWIVPLAAMTLALGPDHILSHLALFFSKLAVVSFGGAYAVLAYMTETVVVVHNWLLPGQMLDALGLAETTPGPLILVTEFVGYLAAFRQATDHPILLGVAGAAVTLWATFAPCFLWIFAGAPYIEWLNTRPRLKSALSAITAAVVGVILNLAIWFALHVFFAKVNTQQLGIFRIYLPDSGTLNLQVVAIAMISTVLLLARQLSVPLVLGTSAALALVIRMLTQIM